MGRQVQQREYVGVNNNVYTDSVVVLAEDVQANIMLAWFAPSNIASTTSETIRFGRLCLLTVDKFQRVGRSVLWRKGEQRLTETLYKKYFAALVSVAKQEGLAVNEDWANNPRLVALAEAAMTIEKD
jgi:hypothetical protein